MTERDLAGLWAQAWDVLEEGVRDARSPARIVALATVGSDGPEARMIALREADRNAATVELHTDAGTAKRAEIDRDPRTSVLVWHPGRQLQIRLRCIAAVIDRNAAAKSAWKAVPDRQRWNYGAVPPPGQPIPEPDAFERSEAFEGFVMLRLTASALDVVSLAEPHRRALYRRSDGFGGGWLSP